MIGLLRKISASLFMSVKSIYVFIGAFSCNLGTVSRARSGVADSLRCTMEPRSVIFLSLYIMWILLSAADPLKGIPYIRIWPYIMT